MAMINVCGRQETNEGKKGKENGGFVETCHFFSKPIFYKQLLTENNFIGDRKCEFTFNLSSTCESHNISLYCCLLACNIPLAFRGFTTKWGYMTHYLLFRINII